MIDKGEGWLLANLGTPDAPTPEAVGRYLREFLMDPHVIDIPAVFRWLLVNVVITPRRKHASAKAYQKIWSEKGSPLRFHSSEFIEKLRAQAGVHGLGPVAFGMRYGTPSLAAAFRELVAAGVKTVRVVPLYPQYALASSESTFQYVEKLARKQATEITIRRASPFFDARAFIEAQASEIRKKLSVQTWDHVLFSFHGLPVHQIQKISGCESCFESADCCEQPGARLEHCYRAQCLATAKGLAENLRIPREKWSFSFQSRLGRKPWIRPYTDEVVPALAKNGVRHLVVACPSFVSDCLETLEEVGIRVREQFEEAGGTTCTLVSCVNASPEWVAGFASWLNESCAKEPRLKDFKARSIDSYSPKL